MLFLMIFLLGTPCLLFGSLLWLLLAPLAEASRLFWLRTARFLSTLCFLEVLWLGVLLYMVQVRRAEARPIRQHARARRSAQRQSGEPNAARPRSRDALLPLRMCADVAPDRAQDGAGLLVHHRIRRLPLCRPPVLWVRLRARELSCEGQRLRTPTARHRHHEFCRRSARGACP